MKLSDEGTGVLRGRGALCGMARAESQKRADPKGHMYTLSRGFSANKLPGVESHIHKARRYPPSPCVMLKQGTVKVTVYLDPEDQQNSRTFLRPTVTFPLCNNLESKCAESEIAYSSKHLPLYHAYSSFSPGFPLPLFPLTVILTALAKESL